MFPEGASVARPPGVPAMQNPRPHLLHFPEAWTQVQVSKQLEAKCSGWGGPAGCKKGRPTPVQPKGLLTSLKGR